MSLSKQSPLLSGASAPNLSGASAPNPYGEINVSAKTLEALQSVRDLSSQLVSDCDETLLSRDSIDEPLSQGSRFSFKPSMPTPATFAATLAQLENIDDFIARYKLTSTLAHIRSYVNTNSTSVRLALLVAIFENYQSVGSYETIQRLVPVMENIKIFFDLILAWLKTKSFKDLIPNFMTTDSTEEVPIGNQSVDQTFTFNPFEPIEQQVPDGVFAFLDSNMCYIRPILGFLALFLTCVGFNGLLSLKFISDLSASFVKMSAVINARNTITKDLSDTIDAALTTLYSFGGKEYIPPSQKKIKAYSDALLRVETAVRTLTDGMKTDFFGVMYSSSITDLQKAHDDLEKMYTKFTENEKSTFNFRDRLSAVYQGLVLLRSRRVSMIKSSGGKQEPVRIWIAGQPGIGKTKIALEIAQSIDPSGIYVRNSTDEFWNDYVGQTVCIFDDILQRSDGKDVGEWHKYASSNACDVVNADLRDKGTPFTSRFMIATSNFASLTSAAVINDLASFNRRRDFLVIAHNPTLDAYKAQIHAEPPPDWFEHNPTRYYIWDPLHLNSADPKGVQIPPQQEDRFFIGEVSINNLIDMATGMEKFRRESFRQRLQQSEVGEYVNIPVTPFTYDRKTFDFQYLFHNKKYNPGVAREMIPTQVTPVRPPRSVADSDESSEVFNQSELSPVSCGEVNRSKGILFLGPPGIGKSFMVHESFEKDELLCITSLMIESGKVMQYISENTGKVIFFDDVTTSQIYLDAFRSVLVEYDAGIIKAKGLIACGNPDTPIWSGHLIEQIERRCGVIKVKFEPGVLNRWKKVKPESFLGDMCDADRAKYLVVYQKGISGCGHWPVIRTGLRLQCGMNSTKTAVRVNAFVIPMPQDFDYILEVPMSFADLDQGNVNLRDLIVEKRDEVSIKQMKKGKLTPVGILGKAGLLLEFKPLITQSWAHGSPEEFVACINREKISPVKSHTIIKLTDCMIGFLPSDDRTLAYVVDQEDSAEDLQIVDGRLVWKGQIVAQDSYNNEYHDIAKRLFSTASPVKQACEVTQEEVLQQVALSSPLAFIVRASIGMMSLAIKGLSWYALISTMYERSGAEVESDVFDESQTHVAERIPAQPERKSRAPKKTLPPGSDPKDVKPAQNVVTIERKNRVQKPVVPPGSDPKDVKPSGNAILIERKARAKKAVVPSGSDPINPKPVSNPILVETKGVSSESAYDPQVRGKKNIIQLEAVLDDGQVVINKEGVYGFIYSHSVWTAKELHDHLWTVVRCPANSEWTLIDEGKLPTQVQVGVNGATERSVQFNRRSPHESVIHHHLGATFRCKHYNMSSIFAFIMAYGIPFDAELGLLAPNVVHQMYHKDSELPIPEPLKRYMNAVFPNVMSNIAEPQLTREGMVDPGLPSFTKAASAGMCDVLDENMSLIVHGFILKQNIGITVAHVPDGTIYIRRFGTKEAFKAEIFTRNRKIDLALFRIVDTTFPPSKDLSHLVMTQSDLKEILSHQMKYISGVLVVPDEPLVHSRHMDISALVGIQETSEVFGKRGEYVSQLAGLTISGVTVAGDCGGLVLVENKRYSSKIIGIHRAGNKMLSVCSFITREGIQKLLESPESLTTYTGNDSLNEVKISEHFQLYPEIETCRRTGLALVGRLEKSVYIPDSTRIHSTGMVFPEIEQYEPSIMSTHDPRSNGRSFMTEGLQRYGDQTNDAFIDQDEIDDAMREIGNEIANQMISSGKRVRVFTKTEAVNTPPYEEYPRARPIDRNGSAGFPHNYGTGGSAKRDFLHFNEEKQMWYFNSDVESQRISSKVDQLIYDAQRDVVHSSPFVAYLKDEPLKLKKIYDVNSAKTRVFFAGTMEYLIAYRMYFQSALLRMIELCHQLPIKVGISAQIDDWSTMSWQLKAMGARGFASDVSSFDSSVRTAFLKGVRKVYEFIYGRCSEDGENVAKGNKVRDSLHRAIEGAYVINGRSLYKLDQAQVSGNPGTAHENSMIMWCLFYLVWRRLAEQHSPEQCNFRAFKQNVCLAVYGDDNICTVHPSISWFNFNTFAVEARKYGFNITDAAKMGGEVPDFQPLSEMEFLKRGFHDLQGYQVGPLMMTSIVKALSWVRDNSCYRVREEHVPSLGGTWPVSNNKELITSSVDNLWGELALHGQDKYYEMRDKILAQSGPLGLELNPPTWKAAMSTLGYNVFESDYLGIPVHPQSHTVSRREVKHSSGIHTTAKRLLFVVCTVLIMSGLGEALPMGENSGTVTDAVRVPSEQIPDNPQTIKQSTGLETITQILYRNWIYRNSFAIDPSMQPGHIFGYFKIHPYSCNEYITHVAKMFVTWTGSMKIRARFMANFANGGSFRMGFLPPIFKEEELQTLPLTTLTAYPNRDLDPKNTDWVEHRPAEERNIAFHYMSTLEDPNPATFGGWVTFYVAGSLVQTLNAVGGVTLLVETAGDFHFDQPADLTSGLNPDTAGPLPPEAIGDILVQAGCDDYSCSRRQVLYSLPSTEQELNAGFLFASSTQSKAPWLVAPNSSVSGPITSWIQSVTEGSLSVDPSCYVQATESTPNTTVVIRSNNPTSLTFPSNRSIKNYTWTAFITNQTGDGFSGWKSSYLYISGGELRIFSQPATLRLNDIRPQGSLSYIDVLTPISNQINYGIYNNEGSARLANLRNMCPGESIVVWYDLCSTGINMQTHAMARALSQIEVASNTSFIYELRHTAAPSPLMMLRLQPSGMWSTSGNSGIIIQPASTIDYYYLRFIQELPVSTPSPWQPSIGEP